MADFDPFESGQADEVELGFDPFSSGQAREGAVNELFEGDRASSPFNDPTGTMDDSDIRRKSNSLYMSNQIGIPFEAIDQNYEASAQSLGFQGDESDDFGQIFKSNEKRQKISDDLNQLSDTGIVQKTGRTVQAFFESIPTTVGQAAQGSMAMVRAADREFNKALSSVLPESVMEVMQAPLPEWIDPFLAVEQSGRFIESMGQRIAVPEEERNLATDIAGAGGQIAVQVAAAFLNPALGLATMSGQGAEHMERKVEQAGKAGTSEGDIAIVGGGLVTGMVESIQVGKLVSKTPYMGKLVDSLPDSIKGKWMSRLIDPASAGAGEAVQEITEGVLNDAIAKATFNPEQEFFQEWQREAQVGGGAGFLFRAMVNAVGFRRASIAMRSMAKAPVEPATDVEGRPINMEGMLEFLNDGNFSPESFNAIASQVSRDDFANQFPFEPVREIARKAYDGNETSQASLLALWEAGTQEEAAFAEQVRGEQAPSPFAEAPSPDKIEIMDQDSVVKTGEEFIAPTAPSQTIENIATSIENAGRSIDKGLQKAASLSTRIGSISTQAKVRMESMDQEEIILSNEGTKRTDPFIDSVNRALKGLSIEEKLRVSAEISNFDQEALSKRGIAFTEEIREFLDSRAERLPSVSYLDNYFPRRVNDLDGLYDLFAKEKKGIFSEAIANAESEKGSKLTTNEKRKAVAEVLKQRRKGGATFAKARSIFNVTPEMMKFYEDPLVVLRQYNHKSAELISRNEFLGTNSIDPENVDPNSASIDDEAIEAFIERDLNNLSTSEQSELRDLISSRLKFSRGGDFIDRMVRIYRTGAALKYVSGIKTIMVQFGDMSVNAYENGISNVIGNLTTRRKYVNMFGEEVKLSLEDAGIDSIDQEIREALKTRASVSKFALAGLRLMDLAMKQNMMNTIAFRWERQAESNPKGLKSELMDYFGHEEFVDGIIKDIKAKRLSPDLNFAFYVKLSEIHPTGISQHTKFYVNNPKLRGLFVLKSFAFKRYDFIYNRALKDMVSGMTQATAGAVRGDSSQVKTGAGAFASGVSNMFQILALMYTAETLIEMLYYQITPDAEDDERKFIDTYLENVSGIFPFFNMWDFKRGLDRGKMWESAWDMIEPPSPIGADPLGELLESFHEDKPFDWNELKEEIPFIGPLIKESRSSNDRKTTPSTRPARKRTTRKRKDRR